MSISAEEQTEQLAQILKQNEQFLLEQEDIEDIGVGIDDEGRISIKIRYPHDMPPERRRQIQERIGTGIPIDFRPADRDKRAY
ncbi:MAG: hypothetical protein KY476_16820 [Planctomycetes bacterium]|nr:hypothetical protein [Planctomycetota bacterium]